MHSRIAGLQEEEAWDNWRYSGIREIAHLYTQSPGEVNKQERLYNDL
jgi:hypothetical protein